MSTGDAMKPMLPDGLHHLSGKILDPDSHEQMPAQVWASESIEVRTARHWMNMGLSRRRTSEITPTFRLPGGRRRSLRRDHLAAEGCGLEASTSNDAMDAMGIARQLIRPPASSRCTSSISTRATEPRAGATVSLTATSHARVQRLGRRSRSPTDSPVSPRTSGPLRHASDLVDSGIRAIWMQAKCYPVASPAHPELDALWTLFEKNDVAPLHGGMDTVWVGRMVGRASLQGSGFGEFRVDPDGDVPTTSGFLTTMISAASSIAIRCSNGDLRSAGRLGRTDVAASTCCTRWTRPPKGEARQPMTPRGPSTYVSATAGFSYEPVHEYTSSTTWRTYWFQFGLPARRRWLRHGGEAVRAARTGRRGRRSSSSECGVGLPE